MCIRDSYRGGNNQADWDALPKSQLGKPATSTSRTNFRAAARKRGDVYKRQGYAAYYLVRKNFALAMPYLVEQGFSRGDLGFALSGISIAYGFSKFIMGSVSDRSNPRVFLPAGLILAAAVMLFMGFVPWRCV